MRNSTRMVILDRKPWTPANMFPFLWLDAADFSTLTLNSSTVSQWRDKSGNGRHASQATPSAQPQLILNAINNLSTVRFDGIDNFLSTVSLFLAQPFHIFIVVRFSDEQTYDDYRVPIGGNDGTFYGLSAVRYGVHLDRRKYINAGASLIEPTESNPHPTGYSIYNSFFNGSSSSLRLNSLVLASGNAGTNHIDSGLAIGGYGPYQRFKGDICEVILCASDISIPNRQSTEGYLAHKWGLTANLPSDHPFRFTPPLV